MTSLAFRFDSESHDFEAYGQGEGTRFWYARDLMGALGYENFDAFSKTCINKAIGVCMTLKISVMENFQEEKERTRGKALLRLSLVAIRVLSNRHEWRFQKTTSGCRPSIFCFYGRSHAKLHRECAKR